MDWLDFVTYGEAYGVVHVVDIFDNTLRPMAFIDAINCMLDWEKGHAIPEMELDLFNERLIWHL